MQAKTIIITSSHHHYIITSSLHHQPQNAALRSCTPLIGCVRDSARGTNLVGADHAVPEAGHITQHGRRPVPSRRAPRQCHDRVQVLVHLICISSLSQLRAFSRSLFWLQVNRAYPPAPVRPNLALAPA